MSSSRTERSTSSCFLPSVSVSPADSELHGRRKIRTGHLISEQTRRDTGGKGKVTVMEMDKKGKSIRCLGKCGFRVLVDCNWSRRMWIGCGECLSIINIY